MSGEFEAYLLDQYTRVDSTTWTDGFEVFTIDDGYEWIKPTAFEDGYWAYTVTGINLEEAVAILIQKGEAAND